MPILNLHTDSASYPIVIDDFLNNEKAHIQCASKALLVSNPKVAGLYLHRVLPKIRAQEVYVCVVPDGEEYKTMQYIDQILSCAFAHRLDRKSLMIALGGGVISDMVGFASGIFERGIDFVSIPTTLLAQVDASVGGKCGINNMYGKNLVGLFHQPKAVYIDSTFLATLPLRELKAGLAEMLKIAICFDKEGFEALEKADSALLTQNAAAIKAFEPYIYKAIKTKAEVVAQDERESGIRAGLNYGHTFGHVIEKITNYTQFLHGEAVAIGMKMANALALKLSLLNTAESKRIDSAFKRFGLDMTYTIDDVAAFYEQFFLDKKSTQGKIAFILPRGIGQCVIRDDIAKDEVLNTLAMWQKH